MELVKIDKTPQEIILAEQKREKEIAAMELLPVGQRPFIMALIDSRISEITPADACKDIYKILKVVEMDGGFTNVHNDDIIVLAKSTFDFIQLNYKGLTTSEFRTACKNGVLKAYGEFYGFCLKSIIQWIEGYISQDIRIKTIREWSEKVNKAEISDKPLVSKMFFSIDACYKAFEAYKTYKKVPFAAFAYYDIINDLIGIDYGGVKTLVTDPIIRKEITIRLTEKHTNEILYVKKHQEEKGNLTQAEALMGAITSEFKENNSLKNLIKAEFLMYFFDQLIKENKNLNLKSTIQTNPINP